MKKYHKELPITVWEDKTKATKVVYYPDKKNLYLEFNYGHWNPHIEVRICINSFWHEVCQFMETREVKTK